LEGTIGAAAACDVGAEMWSGLHKFGIGVFQATGYGRIVKHGSMGKDIADGRLNGAEQKPMSFVKARDHRRIDSRDQRKRSRGLGRLHLDPGPGV
jgi:hypothetical protein